MDGRGRWIDNVFIERLWRSLKYEDIYLKGYADGREAKAGIGAWLAFYNHPASAPGAGRWRSGATAPAVRSLHRLQAVDMTLRLDNAGALPTSPQPQQQQALVA
jgi:putative transposase